MKEEDPIVEKGAKFSCPNIFKSKSFYLTVYQERVQDQTVQESKDFCFQFAGAGLSLLSCLNKGSKK